MRIAVVGGGIAGLSAGWSLASKHDVVLFEKEPVAGGHAFTIEVPNGAESAPADIGFLILQPWSYSNLLALLRHFRVSTRIVSPGVTVSADFGDGSRWSHLGSTALSVRLKGEIDRFHELMRRTVADPAESFGQKL
jgi:predicted NAD/FAD-binding protein